METIGKKLMSIVAGIAVLIGWGWFRGCRDGMLEGGPVDKRPIPSARMTLSGEGGPLELRGWDCMVLHPDRGAVSLALEGPGLQVEALMDLNGDGRTNGKDEFEDVDDIRANFVLIGKTFTFPGDEDDTVTLEKLGACPVVKWSISPAEIWRPPDYNGSEAWRGSIELVVKTPAGEKTLKGEYEGPLTHVW